MSKVKRILSVIMAMVMVLAMSVPTFATVVGAAAEDTAALTVTGLVPEEATEVRVYKVVEWDAAKSAWKLAQGVTNEDVDLNQKSVVINWNNFVTKRSDLEEVAHAENVIDGVVTFNGLKVGAYYVYAASQKTAYNPMGEAVYTYDETTGLMVAADKTIDAKGSTYTLTKAFEGGENGKTTYQVVERGQEVPFTITAVFPSYDKDTTDRAFQITDEPTGMKVTEVTVKVNDTPLTLGTDYTLVGVKEDNKDGNAVSIPAVENAKVRVRFTPTYIGTKNVHAGQTVEVTVKAQVTDADSFSNKASSDKGSNTPQVDGKLGSIAINKYDENGEEGGKLLAGAEFSIAPVGNDTAKIQFVYVKKDSNGVSVYKKATAEEIRNDDITKVTNIVAEDGKVIAKGLDDGEYKIVEEKAPAGYSVVSVDNAKITNGTNPTVEVDVADTQLHSLPHTGGIGTTIFTIGGCAIMIVAAGLFFATRRKTQK
ncbi:SpaH/EbpB family LPXTG-anchored major pilin [Oliverpabstia intestinalis]|uniref:SpaH/EbpB family LPXTG-anchored major pilin n=1 Tax=Oliverpabstia intestinalis TaxID=2606633 RepID=UPI003F8BBE31